MRVKAHTRCRPASRQRGPTARLRRDGDKKGVRSNLGALDLSAIAPEMDERTARLESQNRPVQSNVGSGCLSFSAYRDRRNSQTPDNPASMPIIGSVVEVVLPPDASFTTNMTAMPVTAPKTYCVLPRASLSSDRSNRGAIRPRTSAQGIVSTSANGNPYSAHRKVSSNAPENSAMVHQSLMARDPTGQILASAPVRILQTSSNTNSSNAPMYAANAAPLSESLVRVARRSIAVDWMTITPDSQDAD